MADEPLDPNATPRTSWTVTIKVVRTYPLHPLKDGVGGWPAETLAEQVFVVSSSSSSAEKVAWGVAKGGLNSC